jgi:hypothetical protein
VVSVEEEETFTKKKKEETPTHLDVRGQIIPRLRHNCPAELEVVHVTWAKGGGGERKGESEDEKVRIFETPTMN